MGRVGTRRTCSDLASAAVSAYWALGGDALLDTVGGEIEEWGRDRQPGLSSASCGSSSAIKTGVALAAPILAAPPGRFPRWMIGRLPRILAGSLGSFSSGYGGVLTAAGLLIPRRPDSVPSQDSDQRALAWHTFLWDPWFAVWGRPSYHPVAHQTRPEAQLTPARSSTHRTAGWRT